MLADSLKSVANNLIDKFGETVTFRKRTLGDYVPSLGKRVETVEETSTKAVVSSYTTAEVAAGNGLIEPTDVRLTIAVENLDKTAELEIRGKVYKIVNFSVIGLQGQTLIYDVQCRSAA